VRSIICNAHGVLNIPEFQLKESLAGEGNREHDIHMRKLKQSST
jgi:hypothetical protein